MKAYLATFLKYKYLLHNLISRDLKVKYRRSTLGLLWSVLNPLLMSIVISIVFQNFFRFDVPNFAIYYLTGSLIFNFMNEATSSAMVSIVGNAPLIKKVYIPKYIFPLEKVMFAFVNMLFSMIALVIMMGVTKLGIIGSAADLNISWTIVLFFIPMLYTLVFSLGLGLILAAVNVYFNVVEGTWAMNIIRLNPMYYFVTYFRDVVTNGTVPGLKTNLLCMGISLLFLVLGLWVFKKKQDRFILFI